MTKSGVSALDKHIVIEQLSNGVVRAPDGTAWNIAAPEYHPRRASKSRGKLHFNARVEESPEEETKGTQQTQLFGDSVSSIARKVVDSQDSSNSSCFSFETVLVQDLLDSGINIK